MDIKVIDKNIKFKFRVSGIVINEKKVLVCKYKDKFCLPGGYVEVGEDSESAVLREMFEETNLEYDIVECLGVIENFFTNIKGVNTHEIDFYYKLKVNNKYDINNLELDRVEHDGGAVLNHHFKWIDIDQIDSYDIVPNNIKNIIKNDIKGFHIIIK